MNRTCRSQSTCPATSPTIVLQHHYNRGPPCSPKGDVSIWAPLSLEISYNMPNWAGVFVASVMLRRNTSCFRGGGMCFDRCAGGHNFDFDTDVCTRCGIARRQYRDDGNPECAPRHMVPIVTTIRVPSTHLGATSAISLLGGGLSPRLGGTA